MENRCRCHRPRTQVLLGRGQHLRANLDRGHLTAKRRKRTFQHLPPPLLLTLNDHSQKVVSRPERLVFYLLRHQFLHGFPQPLILLEVCGDRICFLLHVKFPMPLVVLGALRVSSEAVHRGMYSMQLRIEAGSMNDPLAVLILALEKNCI